VKCHRNGIVGLLQVIEARDSTLRVYVTAVRGKTMGKMLKPGRVSITVKDGPFRRRVRFRGSGATATELVESLRAAAEVAEVLRPRLTRRGWTISMVVIPGTFDTTQSGILALMPFVAECR
jgi:hypothetical protein